MKKILCAILAVAMLLALGACGSKKATYEDAGWYDIFSLDDGETTLTSADLAGMDWAISLQLNDGGTGVLDMDDGDVTDLTWQDGSITVDGDTVEYVLAGGMLTLDLSDSDGTLIMIFKKGAAPAEESAAGGGLTSRFKNAAAGTAASGGMTGTYKLVGMQAGEEITSREDIEALEALDMTVRLYLNEDGTGILNMYGDEMAVTWSDDAMTLDGGPLNFSQDGSTLVLSLEDESLTFEKISDTVDMEAPAAEPAAEEPPAEEPPAEEPAPAAAGFEPVTGTLGSDGEYTVTILGAEYFTDSDDKDAVRFYYDFTNNSGEATSAWSPLYYAAEEDGYELVTTYAWSEDDVDEYGNDDLRIQPGITIRCIKEYSFKPDGGAMTFTLSDWDDNEVTATFDPAALPGRPDALPIAPIADPQFFLNYEASGSAEEYSVAITGAEVAEGDSWYSDEYTEVIRAFFDFTNNGSEATSCWWATNVTAYQDGVELETGYPEEDADSDDAFETDIEPGESISCSKCWALRSDSPVEVVFSTWDGVICAGTFYFE